jgi:hypothetical protein
MNKQSIVYKLYNNNELLYIGITIHIKQRLEEHKLSKKWYVDIDKIYVSEKLTRNEVKIYEIYYITKEKPKYNSYFTDSGDVNITLPELTFNEYIKPTKVFKQLKSKLEKNIINSVEGELKMVGDNKHIYNIILEKEVKKQIDEVAKNQERSSSWLINNILKNWLEKKNKKNK